MLLLRQDSDEKYLRGEMQSYEYIEDNGEKARILVPVNSMVPDMIRGIQNGKKKDRSG